MAMIAATEGAVPAAFFDMLFSVWFHLQTEAKVQVQTEAKVQEVSVVHHVLPPFNRHLVRSFARRFATEVDIVIVSNGLAAVCARHVTRVEQVLAAFRPRTL